MDAKTLKEQLTDCDIIKIVQSLGEDVYSEEVDKLVFSTSLCHGGDSPNKLYYFKNEKYFIVPHSAILMLIRDESLFA